jgi:hypothetical protein
MRRLRALWQSAWADVDRRVRLGRILGLVFLTAGFVSIGLAWNGSANKNFSTGQFPYLLSGGVMGLAMVVLGSTLLFLSTIRAERQVLTDKWDEMSRLLGRNLARMGTISSNGSGESRGQVVATEDSYHLAECRVLEGKTGLTTISVEQAAAEGLAPCRVCDPPLPAEHKEKSAADRISSSN